MTRFIQRKSNERFSAGQNTRRKRWVRTLPGDCQVRLFDPGSKPVRGGPVSRSYAGSRNHLSTIEKKLPAYNYRIVSVEAWEQRQVKAIRDFMEKAKAILLEAGFPDEAITLRIDERDIGIARDIAAESQNGYKALVVGRRGLSDLKDFMLGSVASNILGLVSIPVWIVGGKYPRKKFLLCLNDSEGAMLALNHVADVLGASKDCEVTLFHAVRSFHGFRNFVREVFSSEGDKTEIERIERELDAAAKLLEPSFDKARAALVSSGVDAGENSSEDRIRGKQCGPCHNRRSRKGRIRYHRCRKKGPFQSRAIDNGASQQQGHPHGKGQNCLGRLPDRVCRSNLLLHFVDKYSHPNSPGADRFCRGYTVPRYVLDGRSMRCNRAKVALRTPTFFAASH